jgi:serine/threonine protein kinase
MGEVYRARDVRLGRDVAIKALPAAFAADPGRLSRFRREAQTLASLNHPNIAAIYGLEEAEGAPHLVLELVTALTRNGLGSVCCSANSIGSAAAACDTSELCRPRRRASGSTSPQAPKAVQRRKAPPDSDRRRSSRPSRHGPRE